MQVQGGAWPLMGWTAQQADSKLAMLHMEQVDCTGGRETMTSPAWQASGMLLST